ncbi:RHS repeat-associated core domain-containing protein [Yeguia hominis]|uniref:RHS repeat-associated core domain-containing protein n=1 Tax=Yeguia hominis TaxID=2763662 RepID=A0A926D8X6_9FIRM|nr:RHS repeat-associated core domain-containing protein [Yeguia hominis]MBC8533593.1 RHS repeat-associated core domain-containing protein [Yeguia hominis]
MRVGNLTYTYDNLGNIKTVKEGTELKESYTYDSLNQLVRHDSVTQNKTIVYTYDAGGNILNRKEYAYMTEADLSAATPTSTVVYTYGDSTWKDKLTAYDGQSIAYDAIGNPITYRGWSNTWQGRQLSSTSQGGMTLSFKYNVDGIRTQKTVNGTATDFFLNGTKILAQKTGNTVTWFYYDQEGTRVAMEHGGKLYYYLYNLQGDVIALCDASTKQIVAKYSYDAWGKLLTKEGTLADANPFRYRGYYYDSETGMYYLNSRYYDPEVGRFLNLDAIMVPGDIPTGGNLFSYCRNNPIIHADHTGYYVCSLCRIYTPPSETHICPANYPIPDLAPPPRPYREDDTPYKEHINYDYIDSNEDVFSYYASISAPNYAAQNKVLDELSMFYGSGSTAFDMKALAEAVIPNGIATDDEGRTLYIEKGYTVVTVTRIYLEVGPCGYSECDAQYVLYDQNGNLAFNKTVGISYFN